MKSTRTKDPVVKFKLEELGLAVDIYPFNNSVLDRLEQEAKELGLSVPQYVLDSMVTNLYETGIAHIRARTMTDEKISQ